MRTCAYDGGRGSDFCLFGAYALIESPPHSYTLSYYSLPRFTTRNHFLSNLVLDSVKFKKLLELQGKS